MNKHDQFVIDMLIRLEDRITKIENFINSIDFSKLKECDHRILSGAILIDGKCTKCGAIA